jgi:hypothetical protein
MALAPRRPVSHTRLVRTAIGGTTAASALEEPPRRSMVKLRYNHAPRPWQDPPVPLTWEYAIHPKNEHAAVYVDDLAFIVCHKGHRLRVSAKVHRIAADGALSPSWVCTATGCNFHVHAQLVGWGTEPDGHAI